MTATPPPAPTAAEQAQPVAWRCFHCDEVFSTSDDAKVHFGPTEYSTPACQINAAEYREMKERMRRYNDEDADIHRQMYGMQGEHATALIREEEKGYARGLADAKRFPADLGLQPVPEQAQPAGVTEDARKWKGLTDVEQAMLVSEIPDPMEFVSPYFALLQKVENMLKERNT